MPQGMVMDTGHTVAGREDSRHSLHIAEMMQASGFSPLIFLCSKFIWADFKRGGEELMMHIQSKR